MACRELRQRLPVQYRLEGYEEFAFAESGDFNIFVFKATKSPQANYLAAIGGTIDPASRTIDIAVVKRTSGPKGLGRDLLHLVACRAAALNYDVTFTAMPRRGDPSNGLYKYYNGLGFKRAGSETRRLNRRHLNYRTPGKNIVSRLTRSK